MRDMERVKRIGRYFVGKPRARFWFRWQQNGQLEAYSDPDWGGDKTTLRSVSAGVIMRGGHCLKTWTKKQQVVSLSSAENELYAAVKTSSEELGIQSIANGTGISCELNLHLDASATWSAGEARGRQSTLICGICAYRSFQSRAIRREEGLHEREAS